jgi:hypothetical protein
VVTRSPLSSHVGSVPTRKIANGSTGDLPASLTGRFTGRLAPDAGSRRWRACHGGTLLPRWNEGIVVKIGPLMIGPPKFLIIAGPGSWRVSVSKFQNFDILLRVRGGAHCTQKRGEGALSLRVSFSLND